MIYQIRKKLFGDPLTALSYLFISENDHHLSSLKLMQCLQNGHCCSVVMTLNDPKQTEVE